MSSVGRRFASAFGTHLLMKVLSFGMTVALTRNQGAAMRGLTFAADLYVNSALFIAKEAVRAVNYRRGAATASDVVHTYSFALLSVVVFVVFGVPIAGLHVVATQTAEFRAAFDITVISLAMAGLFLDLLAEPAITLCVAAGEYNVKIVAEGLAIVVRLASTNAVLMVRGSVLPNGGDLEIAAIAYAVGLFTAGAFSFGYARKSLVRLVGTNETVRIARACGQLQLFGGKAWLQRCVAAARKSQLLFRELFSESLLRLVLTEGEKAVLAARGNLAAQGVYDVVSSLAALVVRLLFRVWEDFAFSVWSAPDPTDSTTRVSRAKWELLHFMMRVSAYIGGTAVAFGPPLAKRILEVLYGEGWATPAAVAVFQAFMVYLPLLAANGLLEAFVRATATPSTLRLVKLFMAVASAFYILACYLALFMFDLGVVALVLVNCVNLAARIGFSLVAIVRDRQPHDGLHSLTQCLPGSRVASALVAAFALREGLSRAAVPAAVTEAACAVGAVVLLGACFALDDSSNAIFRQLRRRGGAAAA